MPVSTKLVISATITILAGLLLSGCGTQSQKAVSSGVTQTGVRQAVLPQEKPQVGFLAPDFKLKDYSDKEIRLSDFRGRQAVMLNFWAGWCPFCLAEMPAMAIIEESYKGKLEVVAVNRGEKKENAKRFTDALNLSDVYTILLNSSDDVFGKYGGFAMPSTFFIDKEGIIRDAHFGPLDSKQMKEKIQSKLGL